MSVTNLPRSGAAVCITLCGGQHAIKPQICRESRFLPTPPAFDALDHRQEVPHCRNVWCGKTRMVWLHFGEKIRVV